jgi:hypothetical protein
LTIEGSRLIPTFDPDHPRVCRGTCGTRKGLPSRARLEADPIAGADAFALSGGTILPLA